METSIKDLSGKVYDALKVSIMMIKACKESKVKITVRRKRCVLKNLTARKVFKIVERMVKVRWLFNVNVGREEWKIFMDRDVKVSVCIRGFDCKKRIEDTGYGDKRNQ